MNSKMDDVHLQKTDGFSCKKSNIQKNLIDPLDLYAIVNMFSKA